MRLGLILELLAIRRKSAVFLFHKSDRLELYFRKNPQKAIAIIRDNCFPTFSNQRGDVNAVWWAANVAEEEARLQRPMSRMEKIKLRRKLGCDGEDASTHSVPAVGGDTCVVGPPNIGYPY